MSTSVSYGHKPSLHWKEEKAGRSLESVNLHGSLPLAVLWGTLLAFASQCQQRICRFSETRKPNCLNPIDTSLWDREWWHYGNPEQTTGVWAHSLLPTESVARDPPYMLTTPTVLTMEPMSRKVRRLCHTNPITSPLSKEIAVDPPKDRR